jgi:hypothetical protein
MKTFVGILMGSVLLLIIMPLALRIAGGGSVAKEAMAYSDELKTSIEDFEKSRVDFSKEVTQTLTSTNAQLSQSSPDLPQIAIDWEENWKRVTGEFKTIETDFINVGKASEEYFKKLDEQSNGLKDSSLRESELKKNQELKDRWVKNYQNAAELIGRLRGVLTEGSDFQRILIAASMRQKIESNLVELQSIANRALSLLQELERFSVEGKRLLVPG